MKRIITLKRNLPSEKRSIKFSYQRLGRKTFRHKCPSLILIQFDSKNGKSPNALSYEKSLQSEMRSIKNLQEIGQTNFRKSCSRQTDTTAMSSKPISSEVMFLQRWRIWRQTSRYFPKKRSLLSTVTLRFPWWDYLFWITEKRILLDCRLKFWIFRSSTTLWSQTNTRRSISRNLTLIEGYIWKKILRQRYRWEDSVMNLIILIRDS